MEYSKEKKGQEERVEERDGKVIVPDISLMINLDS